MTIPRNLFGQLAKCIIEGGVRRATKYLSENFLVRATRRTYRRGQCGPYAPVEFVVTVGRPNYQERKFIKAAKAAGEPFPIRKIQLKHYSRG